MKKILHVKTSKISTSRHIESLILRNGFHATSKLLDHLSATFHSDYSVLDIQKSVDEPFCRIDILDSDDESAFVHLYSCGASFKKAELFYDKILHHFDQLDLIVPPEPWRKSLKEKQERDKIIWEARKAGEIWEKTAELADVAVNTAKESYARMQESLEFWDKTDAG